MYETEAVKVTAILGLIWLSMTGIELETTEGVENV